MVVLALKTKKHHAWRENERSKEAKPYLKWSLKVRIWRSSVLWRCICGGVSWKSMSSYRMNSCREREALLSNHWSFGFRPYLMRRVRTVL